MHGAHNVRNSLAAIAVGLALGIAFESIAGALSRFTGVHRRFEHVGEWHGAKIVDDYAHHPTEVSATLEAARQAFPQARILVVFQPHLFSRTRDQAQDFGQALLGADRALVTEIYPSREAPIPGVDSLLVVEAARRSGHRHVEHCPDWRDSPAMLEAEVRAGDVLLTLGAGDIYRLAERLAAEDSG
jgi:UDP-N-acetylmuramate--alanine ligase